MMTRKLFPRLMLLITLVTLLLSASTVTVFAQDLSFRVDRAIVDLFVNTDGTFTVEYLYDFTNNANADPIDFIDIGMPDGRWSIGNASATFNGQPVSDVQVSDYVDNAVAIGLGGNAIRPGGKGRVQLRVEGIRDVLYKFEEDTVQEDYASLNFQPNSFGSEFVTGQTDMTVSIHLPPGIEPNEPIWYNPEGWPGADEPEASYDAEDRVTYTWQSTEASASRDYKFGAAFPARLVPEDAIRAAPLVNIDFGSLCMVGFCLLFAGIFGLGIYGSTVGARKRKLEYLPPKISIEGHGIKRGLTPIEAGILMQQPMDKILTMILFSTTKKGAATVVTREPLKIEPANPLPDGLQPYEVTFLSAMTEGEKVARVKGLQQMMVELVKSVSEKMKGFSRKETIDYYQNIMREAWQQVESANTPEVKGQTFGDNIEWTMLDRDFEDRTREVFRGPVYVPMWWGRYDPVFRTGGTQASTGFPTSSTGSSGPSVSMPNLPGSDFAASVVNGTQSFAAGVVGDLTSFTSGVTNRTNPVPKPTTSSVGRSGGGGGRSCACACACAGCACACAGGGR